MTTHRLPLLLASLLCAASRVAAQTPLDSEVPLFHQMHASASEAPRKALPMVPPPKAIAPPPAAKPNDVWSVAISRDGKYAAAGAGWWDQPGEVGIWDLSTRQFLRLINDDRGVASVAFSPDGKTLAFSSWAGHVRVVDRASGEDVADMGMPGVSRIAYSPDGALLAGASEGKVVRLWQVSSGEILAELQGDLFRFHCVAFSPDGKRVLAGGGDWKPGGICQVNVWDVESKNQILALKSKDQAILALAVSPDGKTVASGGLSGIIHLWDADTGQERKTLRGHQRWVHAVAFSPDSKTLVSGGDDLTIRFWDVEQGKQTRELSSRPVFVAAIPDNPKGDAAAEPDLKGPPWTSLRALCMTPAGDGLLAGGGPKTVRLYELAGSGETTLPWGAGGVEEPHGSRLWLILALIVPALGVTGWLLARWFRRGQGAQTATPASPEKTPEDAPAPPAAAAPAPQTVIMACSGCGKQLKVPPELAGKKIKCRQCAKKPL